MEVLTKEIVLRNNFFNIKFVILLISLCMNLVAMSIDKPILYIHNRLKPLCGVRNPINDITLYMKNATKVKQSEYPWHTGLYEMSDGTIEYICGGTIIHQQAILTAAHCVYDDSAHKKKNESLIRVAVGKYRSSWNYKEATEQKFEVIRIITQNRYTGKLSLYSQDIAILRLRKPIEFNSAVMPICFDRDGSIGLHKNPRAIGTVVGWGITDNGKISEELLVGNFPIFDFYSCQKEAGVSSPYITYDKFCAGNNNGTSLEQGDSGGALTLSRNIVGKEQHFIYGIVSLNPTKHNNITAFTNVTEHIYWIDNIVKEIAKNNNDL